MYSTVYNDCNLHCPNFKVYRVFIQYLTIKIALEFVSHESEACVVFTTPK